MSTRESDPPEPTGGGAYSGSWADWIEPAPEPVAAREDRYESRYRDDDYDDYDDEYYDDEPAPARRLGRAGVHRQAPSGRAWVAPLLGVLAVLAVVAAVAVQVSKVTGTQEHPTAVATIPAGVSTTTTTSAEPAAAAAGSCASEVNGGHVRGNGPGSTKSGTDVILALQNRYYVDRSGAKVREMYAPDAAAPSVAQIQAGIDSIPAGTTYCVQILPGPLDGQHIMVVNETHPDSTRKTWPPQLVLTVTSGDRTLISAIVPYEDGTPR